jgi:hypothetical protein
MPEARRGRRLQEFRDVMEEHEFWSLVTAQLARDGQVDDVLDRATSLGKAAARESDARRRLIAILESWD